MYLAPPPIKGASTLDQSTERVKQLRTEDDPEKALQEVESLIQSGINDDYLLTNPSALRAMSLSEFDNGVLMTELVARDYRTFAIDYLRKTIKEYNCQTQVEKSFAQLITINYVRILDIQRRILKSLDLHDALSHVHHTCHKCERATETNTRNACERMDIELRRDDILSKELDRAQRQYISAIQTLKLMKQPQMQVNVKTSTAVFGSQQTIQVNNHE